MTPRSILSPAPLLLLLLAVGLAALNWSLFTEPLETTPAVGEIAGQPTTAPGSESARNLDAEAIGPLSAYVSIIERPLFSPSRSQPTPEQPISVTPPVDLPTAAPALGQLLLLGVMLNGGNKLALIREPANPRGTWFSEGADVGGWTVILVEEQRALLKSDNGQIELKLFEKRPVPVP